MPIFHSSGMIFSSQIFLKRLCRMVTCFNIIFDGFWWYHTRSCHFSDLCLCWYVTVDREVSIGWVYVRRSIKFPCPVLLKLVWLDSLYFLMLFLTTCTLSVALKFSRAFAFAALVRLWVNTTFFSFLTSSFFKVYAYTLCTESVFFQGRLHKCHATSH